MLHNFFLLVLLYKRILLTPDTIKYVRSCAETKNKRPEHTFVTLKFLSSTEDSFRFAAKYQLGLENAN